MALSLDRRQRRRPQSRNSVRAAHPEVDGGGRRSSIRCLEKSIDGLQQGSDHGAAHDFHVGNAADGSLEAFQGFLTISKLTCFFINFFKTFFISTKML